MHNKGTIMAALTHSLQARLLFYVVNHPKAQELIYKVAEVVPLPLHVLKALVFALITHLLMTWAK